MFLSVSNTVTPICILKENEAHLVEEIETYLDTRYPEESKLVKNRFQCLQGLGDAISQYPSVRATQIMRGEHRSEENLIESLSSFSSTSHLFHIPTRVVATRSFLVAKFHAFSMLSILVRDVRALYFPVRRVLFSIVCTLMAEEVYFSCLEDVSFSHDTKISLANDLISLWDSGRDPRAVRHLPALESLWIARDAAPPAFGTMEGSSELIRISMDMGEDWHIFLVQETDHAETRWALEEFLFGLSYEEILKVRSRLVRFGISAIGRDEVRSYIGSQPSYRTVKDADPRTIYDFYIDRRDAAVFRKRIALPGPQRTLEEIYLKYLITLA
ncbi:MAG: hypothetical protein LBK43_07070 [Treponema sp.]|jgi:hypothetical protein|nr:hypothetical protein [Treponema sp.]